MMYVADIRVRIQVIQSGYKAVGLNERQTVV